MDVTSYLLGKKAGGGTPINNQNKDITITENGTTTVSADAGYTGLGTVGVTTNVQPDLESKSVTITENTTTTITPTTGKDGLSEVEVTTNVPTSGPDLSEYFRDTIQSGTGRQPGWLKSIKKIGVPLTVNGSDLSYAFYKFSGTAISTINGTSNVTNMSYMFGDCSNITNLDLSSFDTSNVTNMNSMFNNCPNLTSISWGNNFDTSNVTNMDSMFFNCSSLQNFPILNASSVTNMNRMFFSCQNLTDTSLDNVLQMCISATNYTGTKTIAFLWEYTNYPSADRIQALPHYQDFIDAGWTIGY